MSLPVESADLFVPALQELAQVIQNGLKNHFKNVDVSVADCPDLTREPYNLAAKGISGSPKLVDIGGVPNLVPKPQLNKLYTLDQVAELVNLPGGFVIGAGAGPFPEVGVNCEMVANAVTSNGGAPGDSQTYLSKVDPSNGNCILLQWKQNTNFALMGNLMVSKGETGKVVRVRASDRTGEAPFTSAVRTILEQHYKEQCVGLGGAVLVAAGKVKMHIMPAFSETPLKSDDEVNNWLRFYDFSSPMICVGTLVSRDPGLDLRVEHFHGFGTVHQEGGHYHYDTTPRDVQYEAFFVPAEKIYRIDRPSVTHNIGRN